MFVLKTLVLAFSTLAFASPVWRSLNDVESRGLDVFDDFEVRGLDDYDFSALQARAGFANLGTGGKTAAKGFVDSAGSHKLSAASSPGSSARTVHDNNAFHLDRQQPSSDRQAGKVAVQLNHVGKGQPSTVGQVSIPHGTTPDPKTVGARLKHSINTGKEQSLPATSKQDRKAANIAANDASRQAKAQANSQRMAQGQANANAGNFKKGNGKASAGH